MPSPFPGMDPYLEGSEWLSFHAQFCAEIARQLSPRLRPKYVALTEKRFMPDTADDVSIAPRAFYPDTAVATTTQVAAPARRKKMADAPLHLETVMPELVPQMSVEIRDATNRQLVTAIEILSPANKRGEGRADYLHKRRSIFRSSAHLVEIDLLLEGQRVPMRQPLPLVPYFVFISRAEERPMLDIWPIALDEPLPTIPIPLLPGDEDSFLELQPALTTVYDVIGYDLLLDYSRPPETRLSPEAARWVEQRAIGLKKANS
jgi:hypothetical protein